MALGIGCAGLFIGNGIAERSRGARIISVAQEIGSFTIGTTVFPLTKGAANDLAGLLIGSTGDLRLREF